ncbi:hypothetical protein [Streptomyces lunaelactis]|uniref:hypothetical protein n=1 Tax=Streptomyces lunaelactis TaxID=1535768 RepID=UPI0015854086|nr:hypothetical protein [Streptomyces lunaelactis]NUK86723.1 hypothetical protein [Streptomyces lunaelactis]
MSQQYHAGAGGAGPVGQRPPDERGPLTPEEREQQRSDHSALSNSFSFWVVWYWGRRWWATRYTGEYVAADSAEELAVRLAEIEKRTVERLRQAQAQASVQAPPEQGAREEGQQASHDYRSAPVNPPRMVQQFGYGTSPQAGPPWPPQATAQQAPQPPPHPAQRASGAA